MARRTHSCTVTQGEKMLLMSVKSLVKGDPQLKRGPPAPHLNNLQGTMGSSEETCGLCTLDFFSPRGGCNKKRVPSGWKTAGAMIIHSSSLVTQTFHASIPLLVHFPRTRIELLWRALLFAPVVAHVATQRREKKVQTFWGGAVCFPLRCDLYAAAVISPVPRPTWPRWARSLARFFFWTSWAPHTHTHT